MQTTGGDQLAVRVHPGVSGTLVHLWHGLTGCSESDYVRSTTRTLTEAGHGVLAANHRGCGAGRGLARGTYHSGRAEDLAAVLAFGRRRFPGAKHLIVGFSLSGNALLLQLSDPGLEHPDAGIAVNPPVDLARCVERITTGWNRLYDLRFTRRLVRLVRERVEDGLLVDPPRFPLLANLREFDELFTAPRSGFADADDYYGRCSAGPRLERVEVQTVILTSADDPFVHPDDILSAVRSPAIDVHVEPRGGHLGYLTRDRTRLGTRRWLDTAVAHYVDALMG